MVISSRDTSKVYIEVKEVINVVNASKLTHVAITSIDTERVHIK